MSISMNNMTPYISRVSQVSSGFNRSSISKAYQNNESIRDNVNISSEGKAMSRMLRNDQSKEQREAHKVAFKETYSELGIESLDVENMTDEEITEVLSDFENSMSEHMHEGFKPATDMDSSELKNVLSGIQGMSEKMNGPSGKYGPPPGGKGGVKGPKPAKVDTASSSETIDDDLITTLLEALEEEEIESSIFATRSMTEILEIINQTGNNI